MLRHSFILYLTLGSILLCTAPLRHPWTKFPLLVNPTLEALPFPHLPLTRSPPSSDILLYWSIRTTEFSFEVIWLRIGWVGLKRKRWKFRTSRLPLYLHTHTTYLASDYATRKTVVSVTSESQFEVIQLNIGGDIHKWKSWIFWISGLLYYTISLASPWPLPILGDCPHSRLSPTIYSSTQR